MLNAIESGAEPLYLKHPRLYAKCRELTEGDWIGARFLCSLVVATAHNKGRGGIILDGERIWLPRHVRKMKLHELMGAALI